MINEHIKEIVDEVSDGERDEDVNGRVEAADHVVSEARVLVERVRCPRAGDERMDE